MGLFLKKSAAGILILSIALSFFFMPNPKPARALFGVADVAIVNDPINLVENAATAIFSGVSAAADTITSTGIGALVLKDFSLDTIAWYIANLMLKEMSASVVDWINSGFEGNPAFVDDYGGFLSDIADRTAGSYIYGSQLAFLCQPFALNIRLSLALSRTKRKVNCRISDVTKNIDGFFSNGFNNVTRLESLEQWVTLTADPYSNPYSAYLNTQAELDARLLGTSLGAVKKLDFGRGFQSFELCDTPVDPLNPFPPTSEERGCKITTPGAVIENQLNQTLAGGQQRLHVADEITEIVSALFAQLARQALSGASGLRGLSSGSNNNLSYPAQLVAERDPALIAAQRNTADAISQSIRDEFDYRSAKTWLLSDLQITESALAGVVSCFNQKIGAGGLAGPDLAIAQTAVLQATTTMATKITPRLTTTAADIMAADQNIATLENLRTRVENVSAPTELAQAALQYQQLVGAHLVHNQLDVTVAEQSRNTIANELDTIRTEANQQLSQCFALPG